MINSTDNKEKVKYTAILPVQFIKELKSLTSRNIIKSVNQGIQNAIEAYINENKKILYSKQMEEASKDKEFLKRTMQSQESFKEADLEMEEK